MAKLEESQSVIYWRSCKKRKQTEAYFETLIYILNKLNLLLNCFILEIAHYRQTQNVIRLSPDLDSLWLQNKVIFVTFPLKSKITWPSRSITEIAENKFFHQVQGVADFIWILCDVVSRGDPWGRPDRKEPPPIWRHDRRSNSLEHAKAFCSEINLLQLKNRKRKWRKEKYGWIDMK